MHPFSLKQDNIKQVAGGATPVKEITLSLGESGLVYTTMAVGEEGGYPLDLEF